MWLLVCGLRFNQPVLHFREFRRCKSYKLSYIHNVGKDPLKYITVGRLLELTANKYPEREALVSIQQNQRLKYSELFEKVDKLAAGLSTLGLQKGDRVGLWAPNMAEWLVTKLASARAGFVLVALNPAYQANEIAFCINKVGINALVCPGQIKKHRFYDILNEISPDIKDGYPGKLSCSSIPALKSIITISDDNLRGTFNFNEVLEMADLKSIKNIKSNQRLIEPGDPCNIQFTSGTTGQPKATVTSHFSIVNNAFNIGKRNELDTKYHKICVQVPLFHAFGSVATLGAAIHFGSTVVIPSPTYSPLENLYAIKKENCTTIHGTPTMYIDLINIQRKMKFEINPEIAVSGGAPCSPDLFRKMQTHLKVRKVKSIYGLTETTAAVFQSLPINEDEEKSTTTVGHVGDHLEVKVIDGDNKIVPIGTPGELCVRGYPLMLEYWKDTERTKKIITRDGWLKTGDQFILQEDGYGKIVGRLKDMIIRGGENIFPKEIEDFLHTHPDIIEAQVIGLNHERLGEEVCACVRLKDGCDLKYESLVEFCKKKIAHFKIPTQLKIIDSFPKTETGKVQKRMLKKLYEASNV